MSSNLVFLFNQSRDFFYLLNTNGTIIQTNPSLRDALDYTESELTGKPVNNLFHPADIKRWNELLKKLKAGDEAISHENRVKAKNGRYYNIKWSILLNAADNLVYATGIDLTSDLNNEDQKDITHNIQHIIQSFNEGFFIVDNNWHIVTFNPAFQAIMGLGDEHLKNADLRQLPNLGKTEVVLSEFEIAFSHSVSTKFQYFNTYLKRWLSFSIYPYQDELAVFIRDITSTKIQQLILALEKRVLELNASSLYSLPQTVTELLKGIEEIYPDMTCSVLEVDEAREKIYHLAAPGLPTGYCTAIDGTRIGPHAGSCGTAAYHRTQVIVSDIETSPLWDEYRHLILPFGFKACWSTPIISSNSTQVLATFAVYYTQKREPKPDELQMIERTSNILRILIENKRNRDHVNDQNQRLQEIAAISSHEIRRPVATILGLASLFDKDTLNNPMNKDIINHINSTAKELDIVIHTIVEKTVYLKKEN